MARHDQAWQHNLGDLALWYPTFEVYAATSSVGNAYFHGSHIATPVGLDRVGEILGQFEEKYRDALDANPLPTLDQLRSELNARRQPNGMAPAHEGSPCHNFWHWLHGDS